MTRLIAIVVAGIVSLALAQTALADAMKCSGEKAKCLAVCNTLLNRAAIPSCITDCNARQNMCVRTGCWDNGANRYCGLARL